MRPTSYQPLHRTARTLPQRRAHCLALLHNQRPVWHLAHTVAKRGYEVGGKFSQDPIGSERSRGKSRSQRKHRNDPGWTPTELHVKNQLMRQFMKNPEGPGGASETYKRNYDAIDWSK